VLRQLPTLVRDAPAVAGERRGGEVVAHLAVGGDGQTPAGAEHPDAPEGVAEGVDRRPVVGQRVRAERGGEERECDGVHGVASGRDSAERSKAAGGAQRAARGPIPPRYTHRPPKAEANPAVRLTSRTRGPPSSAADAGASTASPATPSGGSSSATDRPAR